MAADSTATEQLVEATLAEHDGVTYDLTTPRMYTANGGWNRACICGKHLCSHEGECACHREHLAAVLVSGPVVKALAAAKREALEDAAAQVAAACGFYYDGSICDECTRTYEMLHDRAAKVQP